MRWLAVVALFGWTPIASAQEVVPEIEHVVPEIEHVVPEIEHVEPAALPEQPPPGPISPDPISFTLENGLRVMLQPVAGRSFVAVGVTYDVGSGDVPEGWTGLAHMTEHLMFSGTDTIGEVEIYVRLEAAGAVARNAITSVDRTTYYEILPAARIEHAFWIESQRMARMLAGLNEARLERQREVVLHEGWERSLYGWRGVMYQQRYVGVFPEGHPYTRFVEREDDVRAIQLPHVQWFFQRHYAPDNATLIVVGGFEPSAVRASVERYFGPIRRSAPRPEPSSFPPVAPLDHERRITVRVQNDRDLVEVAWPTPALFDEGDAALDLLSGLMVDRREAPLYSALVESGLALEMNARQYSHDNASVFVISAVPARGHTVEECLAAIDGALEHIRAHPFSEDDIERARRHWARRSRLDVEDLGARAGMLAAARGGYVPTLQNEHRRYTAVTSEGVPQVMERWLPAHRRLVLIGRGDGLAPPQAQITSDQRVPGR